MEPVDPLTSSLPPDPAVFDPKPQSSPPVQAAVPLFSTNRDFVNPGRQVQSPSDRAVLATIRVSETAIEDLTTRVSTKQQRRPNSEELTMDSNAGDS
jgi:hypothetical protein